MSRRTNGGTRPASSGTVEECRVPCGPAQPDGSRNCLNRDASTTILCGEGRVGAENSIHAKFTAAFDAVFASAGARVIKCPRVAKSRPRGPTLSRSLGWGQREENVRTNCSFSAAATSKWSSAATSPIATLSGPTEAFSCAFPPLSRCRWSTGRASVGAMTCSAGLLHEYHRVAA